jgi:hypothetical protein
MKNHPGSITLTIIGIIALLAIGGGVAYVATSRTHIAARPNTTIPPNIEFEVTQEESVPLQEIPSQTQVQTQSATTTATTTTASSNTSAGTSGAPAQQGGGQPGCTPATIPFLKITSVHNGTYSFGDTITVNWEACNTSLDISQSWIDRFDQSGNMVLPNFPLTVSNFWATHLKQAGTQQNPVPPIDPNFDPLNHQKQITNNRAVGSFNIKIPSDGMLYSDVMGITIDLNNPNIKYKIRAEVFDGPSVSSDNYFTITQ